MIWWARFVVGAGALAVIASFVVIVALLAAQFVEWIVPRITDREPERVNLICETGPESIGRMAPPRRKAGEYIAMGWQYEDERPDLVARCDEWAATRGDR